MRSHMWMGRHILTSHNVSNVENVKVLVRMMRSVKRYVLVPLPAVSKQLNRMNMAELSLIRTNACPAVCVW